MVIKKSTSSNENGWLMWTHMAHIWIMRKNITGVRVTVMVRDSKHWPGISWIFALLWNTTASPGVLPPLVPPLLQCQGGGTVYLKCSCVLPVTGPLMLVTAVGSEQKAVYFRSPHPSSFSDTHTQREKEPVGDLRKLLVFTVEAFINYGFQSKN